MRRYFSLQCKRLLHYLPALICTVLVLLCALAVAFSMLQQATDDRAEQKKFQVAIAGYTEDPFLQMGLSALEAFDSTRYSIEILKTSEQEAEKALLRGDISAYVVVPEGFMDAAFRGQILPLQFVSAYGAGGLVSIFKQELSSVIAQLLVGAQKGTFGMSEALQQNGLQDRLPGKMDELALVYVDHILVRDKIIRLEVLGIGNFLELEEYLLCGFSVLLTMLCCLCFAPLLTGNNYALEQLLAAKGLHPVMQDLCRVTGCILFLTAALLPMPVALQYLGAKSSYLFTLLQCLPVMVLAVSFSFLLYRISTDLISGILLSFFGSLCMCFLSGCLYPLYFFPTGLQKLAAYLPAAIAHSQISGCLTGTTDPVLTLALLGYSGLFFAVGAAVQTGRIKGVAK